MHYNLRGRITRAQPYQLDKTLSIENAGADAKAVGDAIKGVEQTIEQAANHVDMEMDLVVHGLSEHKTAFEDHKTAFEDHKTAFENHQHKGSNITPSGIELFPGSNASHGGYIDFHYNANANDYTSRIIESPQGTLKLNEHNILTTANIVAILNINLTFTDGICDYANANINSRSVCFIQLRSGAVATTQDVSIGCTSYDGYLRVVDKNGMNGSYPVNILIVNL